MCAEIRNLLQTGPGGEGRLVWTTRVGVGASWAGCNGVWRRMASRCTQLCRMQVAGDGDAREAGLCLMRRRAGTDGAGSADGKIWGAAAGSARRKGAVSAISLMTAIPGGDIFGFDGRASRAYASEDGRVVWDFDTAREYGTVNGVAGRGGSIDSAGAVVAGGMVFTTSGYSLFGGMAGNVLLAFGLDKP